MSSIFSKIINGDIPCYKIAEDDKHFAFLDINPLKEGHTLVVPKKEVDRYFDLDSEDLANLNVFTQKVAVAIKKVIPCDRIGQCIIGLEVPHAHIHLIPIDSLSDMDFTQEKLKPSKESFMTTAKAISEAF